ncbi:hypothetical protein HY635_02620 [Candidatus Uhrbacteria bacterium]|nr:hypothetical protein [Candidatus Uhrbacteria bacterium]
MNAHASGRRHRANDGTSEVLAFELSASGGGGGMAPIGDGTNGRWCPSAMDNRIRRSPHPRSRGDRTPDVLLN